MRLNCKIHKATKEDLENRNVERLNYRPIQDGSFSPFVVYNQILMVLVREINDAVKEKSDDLKNVDTISGPQFARRIRGSEVGNGKYRVLVSADMESAYTNVTMDDIFKALIVVCDYVNVKECIRSLLFKMTHLILTNNYVETVGEVFKLNKCLPMGNDMSGIKVI